MLIEWGRVADDPDCSSVPLLRWGRRVQADGRPYRRKVHLRQMWSLGKSSQQRFQSRCKVRGLKRGLRFVTGPVRARLEDHCAT